MFNKDTSNLTKPCIHILKTEVLIFIVPSRRHRKNRHKLKMLQQKEKKKSSLRISGSCLSVGLGDTLKFVLLLDGVAVRAALGGVDQLVGQALSNRLDVTERRLAGSSAQQPDSLDEKKTYIDTILSEDFQAFF